MIGIFDSGMGGLTVFSEIRKKILGEDLLYFGDTARVPWGNKSKEIIRIYSEEIVKFLISKGAKKIVIACNTSSALAGNYLRKKFPEIIFYDVISPCVEKISKEEKRNILVIGTRATINSEVYPKLFKASFLKGRVYSQACPLFVPFIEEGMQEDPLLFEVAKKYLEKFKRKNIGYVVLGCTHYPLIKNMVRKVFDDKVDVVSSAYEVAVEISRDIDKEKDKIKTKNKRTEKFYFSDWGKHNKILMEKIIGHSHFVKTCKLGA